MAYATLTGEQLPSPDPAALAPLVRQYRTADGRWVSLMMIDEERNWAPACRALGLEDLIDRFGDGSTRRAAWTEIADRVRQAISAVGHE